MKVALCAIAKNEDNYVDHWVKHYFDRGFDSITIYDNNDEKNLVCKDSRVNIINIHNKLQYQLIAYTEFYKNNKDKFDWIAYFDLDEFLDCDNIKDILKSLPENINQLKIKLMDMSDSNFLHADYSISPFERFKEPALYSSYSTKVIFKPIFDVNYQIPSPHYANANLSNTCFSNKKLWTNTKSKAGFKNSGPFDPNNFDKDEIVIHHCDTKTIEEYVLNKFNRTDVLFKDIRLKSKPIPDGAFFTYNVKTKEKLEILSQASYNGLTDLILDLSSQFNENLLNTYRRVYIKENKLPQINESIKNRVRLLNGREPLDDSTVAEFYIENNIEKRKSIEQLKKYF